MSKSVKDQSQPIYGRWALETFRHASQKYLDLEQVQKTPMEQYKRCKKGYGKSFEIKSQKDKLERRHRAAMNIAEVKPILEVVSLDDEPIIQGRLTRIDLQKAIFSIKPEEQENSRVPYAVLVEDDRGLDPYFKVCVGIKIINPEDIPHWILKNC